MNTEDEITIKLQTLMDDLKSGIINAESVYDNIIMFDIYKNTGHTKRYILKRTWRLDLDNLVVTAIDINLIVINNVVRADVFCVLSTQYIEAGLLEMLEDKLYEQPTDPWFI